MEVAIEFIGDIGAIDEVNECWLKRDQEVASWNVPVDEKAGKTAAGAPQGPQPDVGEHWYKFCWSSELTEPADIEGDEEPQPGDDVGTAWGIENASSDEEIKEDMFWSIGVGLIKSSIIHVDVQRHMRFV